MDNEIRRTWEETQMLYFKIPILYSSETDKSCKQNSVLSLSVNRFEAEASRIRIRIATTVKRRYVNLPRIHWCDIRAFVWIHPPSLFYASYVLWNPLPALLCINTERTVYFPPAGIRTADIPTNHHNKAAQRDYHLSEAKIDVRQGTRANAYYHIHFSPQALLWSSQANGCIHTFQVTMKLRADYIRRMTATIIQNILSSSLFTNTKIKIYRTKMMSVVSYWCKTLPHITRKTRNRVQETVF